MAMYETFRALGFTTILRPFYTGSKHDTSYINYGTESPIGTKFLKQQIDREYDYMEEDEDEDGLNEVPFIGFSSV